MAKKKPPRNSNHKVGYKSPPLHSRFRKGTSGNPKGRPKGSENSDSIAKRLLGGKIVVTINGVEQKVTRTEAIFLSIIQRALKGQGRSELSALALINKISSANENIDDSTFDVSADEQLLNEFMRRKRS
jgi:hypothetical protein